MKIFFFMKNDAVFHVCGWVCRIWLNFYSIFLSGISRDFAKQKTVAYGLRIECTEKENERNRNVILKERWMKVYGGQR